MTEFGDSAAVAASERLDAAWTEVLEKGPEGSYVLNPREAVRRLVQTATLVKQVAPDPAAAMQWEAKVCRKKLRTGRYNP